MPAEEELAQDEVQEVLAAFNEEDPHVEDSNEPIEEQDAIDVLLSWKQTRTQISREKLARGLGGSQDLKKLEARVKCFKCQKVGHFSRNCPLRKSKGKGSSKGDPNSSQSSRVSYVNMVKDIVEEGYIFVNDDMFVDDEVTAIVEGWAGRPKDYWKEEGTSVIRYHVVPRSSMFSSVVIAESGKIDNNDRHGWRDGRAVHPELEECFGGSPTNPISMDWSDRLLQAGESPGRRRGGCAWGECDSLGTECHGES